MARLPTSSRERVRAASPRGVVARLQVRPARRAPTADVEAWDLRGAADHARSNTRAVTLIQEEHLAVVAALLGREDVFAATRRNVAVRGLNLEAARGERLRVGEVELELTARCHPCARMEDTLGPGGFHAMMGHGGWCARIVTPGVVRPGDAVSIVYE